MTALHPFQQDGVTQIGDAFRAGHRAVLYQLATGGGKTTVFSHVTGRFVARRRRVGVLVHRRELLDQARARLQVEGIEAAAIAPRQEIDRHAARRRFLLRDDDRKRRIDGRMRRKHALERGADCAVLRLQELPMNVPLVPGQL